MLNAMFGDQVTTALADYIQTAIMLHSNKRKVDSAAWRAGRSSLAHGACVCVWRLWTDCSGGRGGGRVWGVISVRKESALTREPDITSDICLSENP